MKTKKAMKKITHIGMAALVAMGVIGAACSKIESPEIETPETQKENIVTLTTTVGFAADGTKALTAEGVKTFAEGEKMALRYKNKKGDWVKAESNALEAEDIAVGSKSATFTFTLTNPDKTQNVDYIYPAAIVNQSGNMDEGALFGSQDGTLNTLASKFDYSRKIGAWDGDNLPSLTLENQLAILAITLKNADGSSDITSSITGLTLSDGTKTYNVTREAVAGPIYVAIYPTEDATITVTATDGTKNYTKTLTGKTYAKGNGYPVSWRMAEAGPTLSLTSPAVGQVIGSDGKNYAAGASLPTGVTKVAMIAYVSGSNGLAIALADEGSLNWETAKSTCEAKTPAFTNGTWKLPSQEEWNQMLSANGGSEESYTGLNTAITTAGGTTLKGSKGYWSSTPDGSKAYYVWLQDGDTDWRSLIVAIGRQVRACLAF